jgi:hypothetical protein
MAKTETSSGRRGGVAAGGGQGGAVYGLGMIGATVYFWRRAETPQQHVFAVLKGFVWPALLVHKAFETIDR